MKYAIYCGSGFGNNELYRQAVKPLAEQLVERGIDVVYGGAQVGLMGEIASRVLELGGKVTGVMPKALVDKELQHDGLSELFIVEDMHQRKAKMAELASGFIAMPGGMGTLEEIAEVLTWAQLGFHQKPCAFYDVEGYYQGLKSFMQQMVDTGFMAQSYVDSALCEADPAALLTQMGDYQPPLSKWQ